MKKVINAGELKAGDRVMHPVVARMVEVAQVDSTWGNSVVVKFEADPRLILWRRSPVTVEVQEVA